MSTGEFPTPGLDSPKQTNNTRKRRKTDAQEFVLAKELSNTLESAEIDQARRKKVKQHRSTSSQEVLEKKDLSSILVGGEVDLNKNKRKKRNIVSSDNNLAASKVEILATGKVHDDMFEGTSSLASQVIVNRDTALQTVEHCAEIMSRKKRRRKKTKMRCNDLVSKTYKKSLEDGDLCLPFQADLKSNEKDVSDLSQKLQFVEVTAEEHHNSSMQGVQNGEVLSSFSNAAPVSKKTKKMKNQKKKKKIVCQGKALNEVSEVATEEHHKSSMQGVQNGEVPLNGSNAVPVSKKTKKRNKKGKLTVCEDKAPNKVSKLNPKSDVNKVHECVDGTTKVQPLAKKSDTSVEENIGVSLTVSKEEELVSSISGAIISVLLSIMKQDNPELIGKDGFRTSSQVLISGFEGSSSSNDIEKLIDHQTGSVNDSPISGFSSEHQLQQNGENTNNSLMAMQGCDVIGEENMGVSTTGCKKYERMVSLPARDVIENGDLLDQTNRQDNLLDLSISLERAPASHSKRKLLILDLNGLLADIINFQPNLNRPHIKVAGKAVFKRPFCDDFLKFCFERFDVGVWSSRRENNTNAVVNFIMGDFKYKLLFCWGQSKCTLTGFNTVENKHKPLFLKELNKLWNRDDPDLPWQKGEYTPSNTLLLDDSPHKALRNPPYSAIFPHPYNFMDENDNSLGPGGDIRVYLEGIVAADSIPYYVEQHPFGQHAITDTDPHWPFYLRVMGVEHSGKDSAEQTHSHC